MQILANDLFIESTVGVTWTFTEPMALDGKNSVILEAWLISAAGLTGTGTQVQVYVQASNDLENWRDYTYSYGVSFSGGPAAWQSGPTGGGSIEPILFKYVRLKVVLLPSPATAVVRAGLTSVTLP